MRTKRPGHTGKIPSRQSGYHCNEQTQNDLDIQERFHHVRVDIIVLTTHIKAHGNTSVMYKYNSLNSSSLLEAYKLSLKYITEIFSIVQTIEIH